MVETTSHMREHRRLADELAAQAAPVAVAVVSTGALLAVGIATGQPNWQVYAIVMVLAAVGVTALHLRVGFSSLTIWGLVLFGVGHLAGGMVPVGEGILYQRWLFDGLIRYDNVQHAWGFGFAGRAIWEGLHPAWHPSRPTCQRLRSGWYYWAR